MTVPLPGPLHTHREQLAELADLGYTDIWSAEADGADAFTPLALAAAWEPRLRLGTAIVPAYTRSPACLAQCVASLADAAPGRFAIGIGSSSNVIVERWNGVPFVEPYKKVRDVVRFLRDALERREGRQALRHVRGPGLPARHPARAGRRRSSSPRCARACCASPAARPTGRSSTGCRPTTCRTVAGVVQRGRRRRRAGDRRPDLRLPERERRGRAGGGQVRHRRLPQRAGVRRVPPLAGPGRAAAGDVGRLGGRRPQGGRGGDPRRGRRRARRARLAGGLPAAHPAVLRQRGDDEQPGDHAARPRRDVLGRGPRRWPRAPADEPAAARLTPPDGGPTSGARRRSAVRGGHGSRRRGAGRGGGSPRRGGTAPARPRRRGAG